MIFSSLYSELLRSKWAIEPNLALAYYKNVVNISNGQKFDFSFAKKKSAEIMFIDNSSDNILSESKNINKTAIISFHGEMIKYGEECSDGTVDIARLIDKAANDDDVVSILLRIHTGGGSTSSIFPIEESINNAKKLKPVIGLVDDIAASAGYYIMSLCTEIWAIHPKSQVGSIGVMAMVIDERQALENQGIKINLIFPPESNHKNKSYLEALDGNNELIIKEELTPWAIHFQNTVKRNRGTKLNENVEGILSGKMFFAEEALNIGLIDKIGTFKDALNYTYKLGISFLINKNPLSK